MGLFGRPSRRSPPRRPRGGTALRDAYIPVDPVPAPGEPPVSPGDAISAAGVAPPRPLVWVGTATSGASVWSSPMATGAGQKVWAELAEVAGATGTWPVLTGPSPVPASWGLASAHRVTDVVVPEAEPLLRAALGASPAADAGFKTRLEPTTDAVVEADVAAGYLAVVTGTDGWQLPITVGFEGVGGWSATEHAAVLRYWSRRYQADLVALTESGIGLRVSRPPRTHEAAMVAAEEIYAYCPDVVTHGVGSMWALATTLAVSSAWSLRWTT